MQVKILSSGWVLLKYSNQCWAQVPPGYDWSLGVEDKYIFQPDWNRGRF